MRDKPTTDRGRETADRIIAAAALFYERGVRATGLDQISEASGSGKGQIYHYFVDKADLALAVIGHQIERVLQSQEPLLSTISTWDELDEWLALLGGGTKRRAGCCVARSAHWASSSPRKTCRPRGSRRRVRPAGGEDHGGS